MTDKDDAANKAVALFQNFTERQKHRNELLERRDSLILAEVKRR